MEFTLAGFRQEDNVRLFVFDRIAADRTRTRFTVGADLRLIYKYRIAVQELPLLCRRILEGRAPGEQTQAFMFTEGEMRAYASTRAAEQLDIARKKKSHRRPVSPEVGQAWRGPAR